MFRLSRLWSQVPLSGRDWLTACLSLAGCLVLLFPGYFFLGQSLTTTANVQAEFPWRASPDFRPQFVYDPTARFYSLPQEYLSAAELRQGRPPLWNPYQAFGAPLLSTLLHAPFYPLKVLVYLLPFWRAADLLWLMRAWLAGLGAYALARRLNAGQAGALAAGVIYMLSGSQLLVFTMPIPNVTALFPWILYGIERVLDDSGRRRAWQGFTAALIGAQFLGGWPEATVHLTYAAALFTLWRAWQLGRPRQAPAHLLQVGLAGALGLGLGAIQLLPFAAAWKDLFNQPQAVGLTDFIPLAHLSSLGVPFFAGMPGKTWLAANDSVGQVMLYVSGPAVVLSLLAMGDPEVRRRVQALAAMAGLWLWYAFGLPGTRLLTALPLMDRVSVRWGLFVPAASLAVIAGVMLGRLQARRPAWRRAALAGGLWLAVMAAGYAFSAPAVFSLTQPLPLIANRLTTTWAAFFTAQHVIAVTGLLVFFGGLWLAAGTGWRRLAGHGLAAAALVGLLWYNGLRLNFSAPLFAYPETPGLEFLRADPGLFRISSISRPGPARTLPPQTAGIFGLYDTRNHDALMSRRYLEFTNALAGQTGPGGPAVYAPALAGFSAATPKRWLDALNVKYLLDAPAWSTPADDTAQALASAGWDLVYDGEIRIYRNPDAMPRAYVTHAVVQLDWPAALAMLSDPRFDPRRETIIEGDLPFLPQESPETETPQIVGYAPLRVDVSVDMRAPGVLVLTDSFFTGWRASLDGVETAVYPANYNFRAVEVPAGPHQIVFWYDTTPFWLGAAVSLGAGLAAGALVAASWAASRQHPAADWVGANRAQAAGNDPDTLAVNP